MASTPQALARASAATAIESQWTAVAAHCRYRPKPPAAAEIVNNLRQPPGPLPCEATRGNDTVFQMKLGQLLLRDRRLSQEQLAESLAVQSQNGGRLGTVLVERGLLDLDTLTYYLGFESGVGIATGATFERAKKTAVRLLSPELAYQCKCVPIVIQDRQLIAAFEDPLDLQALDQVAAYTGYRVIPRIAPEIRIYYYVERFYGVARPPRFLPFGDAPRLSTKDGLPQLPLPGLPPEADASADKPQQNANVVRMPLRRRTVQEDSSSDEIVLGDDLEDLVDDLEADTSEPAEPSVEAHERSGSFFVGGPVSRAYAAVAVEGAIAEMDTAENRTTVADALLGGLARFTSRCALFLVREDFAIGWKAHGEMLDEKLPCVLVPLGANSIFRTAATEGLFTGEAPPATLHEYLQRSFGQTEKTLLLAAAVKIGARVVNIVYGEPTQPLSPEDCEQIRTLCAKAAENYARLAMAKRKN